MKVLAAHAWEFRFHSPGGGGSHQICLNARLTRLKDGGENSPVFLSGSVICVIPRKELSGPFGSNSISRRVPRLGGAGSAPAPCPSCRQLDPMDSRFITEGLKHQMNHCLLMGLAASGVSPSSELTSISREGFRPCCFPRLDHRSTVVAARNPGGQSEDWGGKRRKVPEGNILQSLWSGEFPVKWEEREGEENTWRTSIPQSPFGKSHTHYGWKHEVFIGLGWPEHPAGNNFLQNGEPGQVLFILLTSPDSLLSPKTQGEHTSTWQMTPFSKNNSEFGHRCLYTNCFSEASRWNANAGRQSRPSFRGMSIQSR